MSQSVQCHPVRAQVYAPTFPGYGRSEKPALAYSQELWRDFLRDFVVEVRSRRGNGLRWRGGVCQEQAKSALRCRRGGMRPACMRVYL